MRPRSRWSRSAHRRLITITAPLLLAVACTSQPPESADARTLQVFAAASLAQTFTELGEAFEAEHGVAVRLNFAGSADLVAQIMQGAPADVFASADEVNMARALEAELVEEPVIFAGNTLVIVTPPENPAGVENLADLTPEGVVTVICAPQVPCGAAARQVAQNAGVELAPASEESAVTDVLGKVRAGEADAGLVYRTDAIGAGEAVHAIEISQAEEVLNRYPIAVLSDSPAAEHARAFAEFVTDKVGRRALGEAGFRLP